MAFGQYKSAELRPGKTVEYVLDQLPPYKNAKGESTFPLAHLEWLGETNSTWMNDQIARANAKTHAANRAKKTPLSKKAIADARRKNRTLLAAHAVRDIEAMHEDGRMATKTDIPEWVDSLPDDVVDSMIDFVINQENFRERVIEGDPKELAEK